MTIKLLTPQAAGACFYLRISYADSKKIPYIIIAGENEVNENSVTVKIMSSGEQKKLMLNELDSFVENNIKHK